MKREGVLTIPYQSTEPIRVKVKAPSDPTSFAAEAGLALTAEEDPAVWVPVTWTGQRIGTRYFGTVVLGPFTKGLRYNVYVRVTGGGNAPVMHAGVIEAF